MKPHPLIQRMQLDVVSQSKQRALQAFKVEIYSLFCSQLNSCVTFFQKKSLKISSLNEAHV